MNAENGNAINPNGPNDAVSQTWYSSLKQSLVFSFRVLFAVNMSIYLCLKFFPLDANNYTLCEWTIFNKNQVYRILTHHFVHTNFLHLIINMSILYYLLRNLEQKIGSMYMLCYISHSFIITSLLYLLQTKLLKVFFITLLKVQKYNFNFNCSCGFSSMLFSIFAFTCTCKIYTSSSVNLINIFHLKTKFLPFLFLILAQMVSKEGSFIGHLSGIICSYLIKYVLVYLTFPRRSWISDFEIGNSKYMKCALVNNGYVTIAQIPIELNDSEIPELDKCVNDICCVDFIKKIVTRKRVQSDRVELQPNDRV